jgi:hypothetical protein
MTAIFLRLRGMDHISAFLEGFGGVANGRGGPVATEVNAS